MTRVHIVDDNRALAENIAELLEASGHEVSYDATPEDALRRAFAEGTVLVLDVRMPGMDGVELYRRLLARQGTLRCIFVTAYAADARLAEARALGAQAILPKPFELPRLLEVIDAADIEAAS